MSTASRVIKNTGYLYAKMGITMFISLWTTRLILNGLGTNDFGLYNVVGGAISMLGFINASMASATQRFLNYCEGEGDNYKQKQVFNVSVVLHMVIALIIAIILIIAGFIFFSNILNIPLERLVAAKIVYGCLLFSTIITVISVPYDATLNAHENMKFYSIVGIIESILKLLVAFACVNTSCDKLIVYGLLMAGIPLITMFIMKVYCKKHYLECTFKPLKYYSSDIMRKMTGFAGWNTMVTSTSMVTQYGLGVVLNSFFGVVINAAFGIANQLSGMLMAFSSNMQKAFSPVLVKSEGAHDRSRVIYITLFGCRISYYIFALFAIPAILLMPEILKLWLKTVPMWAVLFCRLQLIRTMLEEMTFSLNTSISAQGNIKRYSIARSIWYVLPLFLSILLFKLKCPPFSMYIVWIVCWCIIGGWILIIYNESLVGISRISIMKGVVVPSLAVTVLSILPFILMSRLISNRLWARLFLAGISVLIFIILGFFVLITKEERDKILSVFLHNRL